MKKWTRILNGGKSKAAVIGVILALMMVLTLFPFDAFATEQESVGNEETVAVQQDSKPAATTPAAEKSAETPPAPPELSQTQLDEETSAEQSSLNLENPATSMPDRATSENGGQEQTASTIEEETEGNTAKTKEDENNAQADFYGLIESGDITTATQISNVKYQTFKNLKNNTMPPELSMGITINYAKAGVEGGRIEIPYQFTPTRDDARFQDFEDSYMGKPFFTFLPDKTVLSDQTNVDRIEEQDSKLIVYFKKIDATGIESINLKFKFNDDVYLTNQGFGVIPNGFLLWTVVPSVFINDINVNSETAQQVVSQANTKINPHLESRLYPSDNLYKDGNGGRLSVHLAFANGAYYEHDFDPDFLNTIYFDVPKGTQVTQYIKGRFPIITEDLGDGYTRYSRKIDNTQSSWNNWASGGDPAAVYESINGLDLLMPQTGFDYVEGENKTFEIRYGTTYKKINAPVVVFEKKETYKIERGTEWELNISKNHGTYQAHTMKSGIRDGDATTIDTHIGSSSYYDPSTTKNTGAKPVQGFKMDVYQEDGKSELANFQMFRINVDKLPNAQFSQYRIDITMKNALTGEVSRVITGDIIRPDRKGEYQAQLPVLNANEYIYKFSVVPMGADGTKEGEFAPKNSFSVTYRIKSWKGQVWPDGTVVPTNNISTVQFNVKSYYTNAEGTPVVFDKTPSALGYYQPQTATQADARLIGTNVNGRVPGDIVDFEIQGFVNSYVSLEAWVNPRVVLRLPKVVELVEGTGTILQETVSSKQVGVTVRKEGEDEQYTYYSFTATGYTTPKGYGNKHWFSIPLQLRVKDSTLLGKYQFTGIRVSSENAADFFQTNGNKVHQGKKDVYGFTQGDNYAVASSTSSELQVISQTRLSSFTKVNSSATNNQWVQQQLVPAQKGETVKMRVQLSNLGNTQFEKVKLYNILPQTGKIGSSGSIAFERLEGVSDAVVYYTDAPYDSLKKYGEHGGGSLDLQLLRKEDLAPNWTTSKPVNPTAIFIEFNGVIKPADMLELSMVFTVPKADDQVVYSQYAYSAQEKGTPAKLNLNSLITGFTTQTFALVYDGNKPADAPTLSGAITKMPDAASGTIGFNGNKLTISAETPVLKGYQFDGWNINTDGTGESYNPGADIEFTQAGTTKLFAQWKINQYNINFDNNYEGASATKSINKNFGQAFTKDELDAMADEREKYQLEGWNTQQDGKGTWLTSSSLIEDGMNVFGQWKLKKFTVTFDNNYENAPQPTSVEKSYGDTFTTEQLAAQVLKRDHYRFVGWYASQDLTGAQFTEATQVINNLNLYAKWERITYQVTFLDGKNGAQIDNPISIFSGDVVARPSDPVREHQSFINWINETDDAPWDFTLPITGNATIYADWLDHLTINGQQFTVKTQDVKNVNYLEVAKIVAGKTKNQPTSGISADVTVTYSPVALPEKSGIYPVTYIVSDEKSSERIVIQAVVTDGDVVITHPQNQEVIQANPILLPVGSTAGMDDAAIIAAAGAKAWNFETGSEVAITTVESTIKDQPGTYTVTFGTDKGTKATIDATIWKEEIVSTGFTVTTIDVAGLTSAQIIALSDAKAFYYDGSGGDGNKTVDIVKVDASALKDVPGTYTVWFETKAGTKGSVEVTVAPAKFTVTFEYDNGAPNATASLEVGTKIASPAKPEKTGYVFKGWKLEGRFWNFETDTMPQKNIKLLAIWEKQSVITSEYTRPAQTSAPETTASRPATSAVAGSPTSATSPAGAGSRTSVSPEGTAHGGAQSVGAGRPATSAGNASSAEQIPQVVAEGTANDTVQLGEEKTPFTVFGTKDSWALVNLLLLAVGMLMVMMQILKWRKYHFSRSWMLLFNVLIFIISIVVFILTSNLNTKMVLVNYMTIVSIIFIIVQSLVVYLYTRMAYNQKSAEEKR